MDPNLFVAAMMFLGEFNPQVGGRIERALADSGLDYKSMHLIFVCPADFGREAGVEGLGTFFSVLRTRGFSVEHAGESDLRAELQKAQRENKSPVIIWPRIPAPRTGR